MSDDRSYLGIDVAKATYQVTLLRGERRRHKHFPNTVPGHQMLLQWLSKQRADRVHAVLEATGTHAESVATALVEAGHVASIINPAAAHAFAQSQLRRAKTDTVDSDVLAAFGRAHQPPAWTPWPRELRELRDLVRRQAAVQDMLTQERNRSQAGPLSPAVTASLTRHIAMLEAELKALAQQIDDHIDRHPEVKTQADLLQTIQGIGRTTAARVLTECRAVTAFESARTYAAFAGLVPRPVASGTWVGRTRLSKLGSARLRMALYFPAITALRCNPVVHAFGQRLAAAGKPKMVIIAAAMRKLLHLIYGVLKHGRPFDPNFRPA